MPTINPFAKNEVYPYPSVFGSHASMLDKPMNEALNKKLAGEVPDLQEDQLNILNSLMKDMVGSDIEGGVPEYVILKDEHKTNTKPVHHFYVTERKYLDNGMADPYRYRTSRLEYMLNQKKE